eukprot:196189-Chlamydomonas_euryale.AAC.1
MVWPAAWGTLYGLPQRKAHTAVLLRIAVTRGARCEQMQRRGGSSSSSSSDKISLGRRIKTANAAEMLEGRQQEWQQQQRRRLFTF